MMGPIQKFIKNGLERNRWKADICIGANTQFLLVRFCLGI